MNFKKWWYLLKKKLKSYRIAIIWFASYLLLIIGVIAVILISSVNNLNAFMNQTYENAVSIMNNNKQSVDYIFNNVENIATELSIDNNIRKFAERNISEVDVDAFFYLYDIKQRLLECSIVETGVKNVFVYFANVDYIMGTNAGNNGKNYYSSYYSDYGITYEEWNEMLHQKKGRRFVCLKSQNDFKRGNNILCLFSVQSNDFSRCIATVGLELSLEELFDINDANQFFVLDFDNNILYSNSRGVTKDEIEKYYEVSDSLKHIKNQDGEFLVLTRSSDISNIKYIFMMSEQVFLEKIRNMNRNIWIYTILSVMLGIIIAYIMTKQNYRPVKRLIDNLSPQMDKLNIDSVEDTFKYLQNAISNLLSQNDELRSRNIIQEAVFKNAVAVKMMKNSGNDMSEALKNVGMEFKYDYFIVVLWYIADDITDKDDVSAFIVNNILEEALGEKYSIMKFELDYEFGYIINTDRQNETDNIGGILRAVSEKIKKEFNISIHAIVSKQHMSMSELPVCYAEAMDCTCYMPLDDEPVVMYGDIDVHKNSKYSYTIEKEQTLISCLKSGKASESKKIIENLLKLNAESVSGRALVTQVLIYDIAGTLVKLLTEINDTETMTQMDLFFSRKNKYNIQLVKKELFSVVDKLCEASELSNESNGNQNIVNRAKKYIDDNYNNPDLNRDMIADHVNISINYLSTIFKKYVGIGLLDYIVSVRINAARDLLLTTNKSIEEISNEVGYINTRTFSRVFLKTVGIQAGQYRKLNSGSKE